MMTPMATTKQFLSLARKADKAGYNRRVNTEAISKVIDPAGKHLIYLNHMEGDTGIVRTLWYVKRKDSDEPLDITLDMDVHDFNRLTRLVG